MANANLTVISGTVATEQDIVVVLDNFLVSDIGWELIEKISDTVSTRTYTWRAPGEEPGKFMDLYSYVSAVSNAINFRSASHIDAGLQSDFMYDATQSKMTTSASVFDFWIAANKDVFYVVARNPSNQERRLCGVGYLKTPYTYAQDPLPCFVLGQSAAASRFIDTARVQAFGIESTYKNYTGGVAGGPFLDPYTTSSGLSVGYLGADTDMMQYAAPHPRDGRYWATPVTLYRPITTSLITNDFRGTLPNIWSTWGSISRTVGTFVTASGINVFSDLFIPDSKFLVVDEYNQLDNTSILGPAIEYDLTDSAIPQKIGAGGILRLWLSAGSGVEHNGEAFQYNGSVSLWRSRRYHPADYLALDDRNDAAQSTVSLQPRSTESVINSLPVIRFTSTDSSNLTGTLDVENEMTIFAVASYANGANRCPIINIRGNVSAADTLFALEFNENSANSATAINIAAGGTDREEVTSLSPNTPYILTSTVSGTTTTLYVNGWDGASSTITNTKSTVAIGPSTLNYSIGVDKVSGGANGTTFADADIAEVLVFEKYLSDEERQSMFCMLSNRYNITVSGTC